ncbi:MAG: hypothetical protein ACK5TQ_21030 [Acetobacteraceae bacterium]
MLEILVLLCLAYLGFGVFLTVSPIIRDSVSLKLHPEKIDDRRVLLLRRVVSHLAIALAWPKLLPRTVGPVQMKLFPKLVFKSGLLISIRATFKSYRDPETKARIILSLVTEKLRPLHPPVKRKRRSFLDEDEPDPSP